MKLAMIAAGYKADVVIDERRVSDVKLDRQSGLARVEYGDGDPDYILVIPVVAEKPPHMGG